MQKAPKSGHPSSASSRRDTAAALRAMRKIAATLDRETAALKRDETARAAREKAAASIYLKGLARAGTDLSRLPSGAGVVSGEARGSKTRRFRVESGAPLSTIAGLGDIVTETVNLPFATLRPPYAFDWTYTKWINYAPGRLDAYARKSEGKFGFDIASSHESSQINRSRARAAIGFMFRPTELGVLGIRPKVAVKEDWYLKWNMRVARTRGWTGMLVQAFDDGELAGTPVEKKREEFDRQGGSSSGESIFSVDVDLDWPFDWGTSLFVFPIRTYVIWIWCGGSIRAAGWQTIAGMNVGSDAASQLDVEVPSIALYFTPASEIFGQEMSG